MDYQKYSKKTWIVTIILAAISIAFDALIMAGVLCKDNPIMKETSLFTLLVAVYILVTSIRNLIFKIRDEKASEANRSEKE